jgi:hypothetical protein
LDAAAALGQPTYKSTHKLLYPVNVGRNVAREEARTHFVLASDVELYPNPGFIPDFLEMILGHLSQPPSPPPSPGNATSANATTTPTFSHGPKVYPLSIFEIKANASMPNNKTQLALMLKNKQSVPFHKHVRICPAHLCLTKITNFGQRLCPSCYICQKSVFCHLWRDNSGVVESGERKCGVVNFYPEAFYHLRRAK